MYLRKYPELWCEVSTKKMFPNAVHFKLYYAMIYPHLGVIGIGYQISKFDSGHPLHLFLKKELTIVANKDYIACLFVRH